VACRSPALLRAACKCAQGTLRELDVSGWRDLFLEDELGDDASPRRFSLGHLIPLISATLLELRVLGCDDLATAPIEQLLLAAPRLRLLECDALLRGEAAQAPRLLQEPLFAPVRLRSLVIRSRPEQPQPVDVPAVVARAALHTGLVRLQLEHVPLDSELALDAVVDLAISQLQRLWLGGCLLSPPSLPALTRMLAGAASLASLHIYNNGEALLEGAFLPDFCAALRASRLVTLKLVDMHLWQSLEDGLAVVAACTGHPTLRELSFWDNSMGAHAPVAVGAALGCLVAADSALEHLDIDYCNLGGAAVRPLFAAVARSSRLRELECRGNDISSDCAREAVLPAIQANASLRHLDCGNEEDDCSELQQAMDVVRVRA